MTARFIVADVFDGLATLEDGSVDLVVTSPPFLALRSYLPADHPDKSKEIGSEATPAEFIDTMLRVTAELRRVLASHGSICVELGDTYAGSTTNNYQLYEGSAPDRGFHGGGKALEPSSTIRAGAGWPLAKSRTLIPGLYQIALAYGINPLTGQPSPAGQWRIRNVVTWARPNPPVGALGDKWRPATSDLIVACTSGKRYWDDLATRSEPWSTSVGWPSLAVHKDSSYKRKPVEFTKQTEERPAVHSGGAPLLDYWVIPPGGYQGAHYAVFPEELVVPCIQAMCPQRVCRVCGEPSRRIVATTEAYEAEKARVRVRIDDGDTPDWFTGSGRAAKKATILNDEPLTRQAETLGWSDCGHNTWRPGLILDPFAGSGTTGAVATGHGHDVVLIDIDERNCDLARERIGPLMFEEISI